MSKIIIENTTETTLNHLRNQIDVGPSATFDETLCELVQELERETELEVTKAVAEASE